jgi:hypothetical protein
MTLWVAVTANPNMQALPGSNVLQKLIDGAEGWGLALSHEVPGPAGRHCGQVTQIPPAR